MYSTSLRLAQSVSTKPLNLRNASAQLYPPIPFVFNFARSYKLIGLSAKSLPCSLYRRLLRAHRNLPLDMRTLGDEYVKSEYRRHRSTTNPLHIIGFLSQWKVYLEQLPTSKDGGVFKGKKLDTAVFEKMSSEQIAQLYELMHVSKDVWKPVLQDNDRRPSDNT